jgi:hypothetical protein
MSSIVVEFDAAVHGDPGQLVLETQACSSVAAQIARLGPSLLGVQEDRVGTLHVEVEPHHRLAGRALVGQHRQDRVAQLLREPAAQLIGQGVFDGQCRVGHGAPPWGLHRRPMARPAGSPGASGTRAA